MIQLVGHGSYVGLQLLDHAIRNSAAWRALSCGSQAGERIHWNANVQAMEDPGAFFNLRLSAPFIILWEAEALNKRVQGALGCLDWDYSLAMILQVNHRWVGGEPVGHQVFCREFLGVANEIVHDVTTYAPHDEPWLDIAAVQLALPAARVEVKDAGEQYDFWSATYLVQVNGRR